MENGYFVKINDNILRAKKQTENQVNIRNFNKKRLIPLATLEKVCEINLKNKLCPINFQYSWFCLNRESIFRKFSTGLRKVKVSFPTVYIENSEKNKKIILDAYNSCKKPKSKIFSKLVCKTYTSIREYIGGKNKIPLFVFLKSCQLLNKNPWTELENCKLYARSSDRSRFIILKNKITPELYIILNWIKLEGFLSLDRPSITISQNIQEYECLKKIKNYFHKVFNLPEDCTNIIKSKTRPNMIFLTINSAPLRQILNLKYDIPLGYKSRKIKPNTSFKFNKEDKLKILASEIETEGSFARHRKYNITHCDLSFSTYSKNYSESVFEKLKNLGYPVSFRVAKRMRNNVDEREYKVVFWGVFELQKFAFEIFSYFHHLGKIRNLIEVISQKDYLKITRIDFNNKLKDLIYNAKDKCGSFELLTQKLNNFGANISKDLVEAWIYQCNRVPIYSIIKMCNILNEKDYFKYIPKELALSLFIQGFIKRKEAEYLRGIKNAYKHIEKII